MEAETLKNICKGYGIPTNEHKQSLKEKWEEYWQGKVTIHRMNITGTNPKIYRETIVLNRKNMDNVWIEVANREDAQDILDQCMNATGRWSYIKVRNGNNQQLCKFSKRQREMVIEKLQTHLTEQWYN